MQQPPTFLPRAAGSFVSTIASLVLMGSMLGWPANTQGQTWNGSASDLWGTAANWTPNTVPNSGTADVTVSNATNNPVLIEIAPTIADLTIGATSSVTLDNDEDLTIAGGTSAGALDIAGTLTLGSSGSDTDLILAGTTGSTITLSGGGTLSLSNSSANRIYSSTGDTLVNSSGNVIEGSGQFGINNSSFAFTLNNGGTVDANQTVALQVAPSNTVTNTGTLEATAGGTLDLIATVTNTGGVIEASGTSSVADFNGSTITGGTLTTASGGTLQNGGTATLNGTTLSTGSTVTLVNGSTTTLEGTTTINGTIAQNSTGSDTDLKVSGTVTLTSSGDLVMSNNFGNRIYGSGSDSLTNDTTIEGAGQIGINNTSFDFTLDNEGTIDANQTVALQVAPSNTVTNTGTLEATAGGTLDLLGGTFTNTGGLIEASGSSSVVNFAGSTITGGTLTTASGGTLENGGTATLSGTTISTGSTVTLVNDTTTTLVGTTTNNGTIAENSSGSDTDLKVSGTVILTSSGDLVMSNNFGNRIYGSGSDSLTNDTSHTIEGAGQIGVNNSSFAFTLDNKGTIDANVSNALQVAPSNTMTNTGTLEATAGGTLDLFGGTFNNNGGVILSTGTGSAVNFGGATIAGGTLTTTSGGTIQNNNTATLDGSTNSPTISTGSTVTLVNDTSTTLMGTITNNGTIAQNSTGSDTDVLISGAVILSGTGALNLSNNFGNRIYGSGSDSLTNGASHTIEGSGQFGVNDAGFGFTLTNNGTILANQSNTLNIAPSGNTTNNGTFQANSGSTLFMNGTLTNYAPGTSTLTSGTYNVFSGTIELSQANTGTSTVIATNAATILLDGAPALIADGSGHNVLQDFLSTNASTGNFTIQNGANLTSASSLFTNDGTMTVGANSTFTVGGSNSYQNNGTLEGAGTIVANTLSNSATVHPGQSPGILGVVGNYHQDSGGILNVQMGGASAGTGFSQLNISATASLAGTLDLSLINGFIPSNGEKFVILTSGGLSGTFSTVNGMDEGNTDFSVAYSPGGFTNDVVVTATTVPEPTSLVLVGVGLLGLGLRGARSRRA